MKNEQDTNANFSQAALEHLDALYGYALALARNRAEAEDLVQETYLRAARAFGSLLPDSNLKGWMFAILRNVWLNQLRHARSGPEFVELDAEEEDRKQWLLGAPSLVDDPHAVFVRKIEREEVRAAIEQLPRHHREVVVLREIEGFSYQQIAGILQCPAGTVMSRLGRAREQLRHLLIERRMGAAK
jgi:RNA polymerase sigma-70 factor (ECF subfamily)